MPLGRWGSLRASNVKFEKRRKRKLLKESHDEASTPSTSSFYSFVSCETAWRRKDEIKIQIGADVPTDELINQKYPCTDHWNDKLLKELTHYFAPQKCITALSSWAASTWVSPFSYNKRIIKLHILSQSLQHSINNLSSAKMDIWCLSAISKLLLELHSE